jgi:hypothetical protein
VEKLTVAYLVKHVLPCVHCSAHNSPPLGVTSNQLNASYTLTPCSFNMHSASLKLGRQLSVLSERCRSPLRSEIVHLNI